MISYWFKLDLMALIYNQAMNFMGYGDIKTGKKKDKKRKKKKWIRVDEKLKFYAINVLHAFQL